jgi:hypothetical protein
VSTIHVEIFWREKSNFSNFCLFHPPQDGPVRKKPRALLILPNPAFFYLLSLHFFPTPLGDIPDAVFQIPHPPNNNFLTPLQPAKKMTDESS